ncbi:MAG: DUF1858 domain-containing protein [Armatimonadota bacterium]
MAEQITEEMTFDEVMDLLPQAVAIFKRRGLHCHECAVARLETLKDGAMLHSFDVDDLLAELNAVAEEGQSGNAGAAPSA